MTDLIDRMRTCAAYIMGRPHDAPMPTEHLLDDAAELLIKAAHLIDMMPEPLGELIETRPLHPVAQKIDVDMLPGMFGTPAWIGDDLKPIPNTPRSRSACPKCDSRAQKTVRIKDNQMWLICPVCEHAWTR